MTAVRGQGGGRTSREAPAIGGVVAILGIFLTFTSALVVGELVAARRSTEFAALARRPVLALQLEIQSGLGTVDSLVAFFVSSQEVERGEFRTFANSLLTRHPGLKALEWLPRVRASETERYERRARGEGYPGFQITEITDTGVIGPAGSGGERFPVFYVEPMAGNEAAFGFDVASEPARRAVLESARDFGRVRVTPAISLVQGQSSTYGFLAVAPIYDANLPTASIDQRRAALTGYALAVFDIDALALTAMARTGPDDATGGPAFDVRVSGDLGDWGGATGTGVLFARRVPSGQQLEPDAEPPVIRSESSVDVADRHWRVSVAPPDEPPFAGLSWLPWAVLVAGLAFTSVASRAYRARWQTIERLNESTEALHAKNELLAGLSTELSMYIPAQVSEPILSGRRRAAIATRRKRLTLFYSDIERFTELTEGLEPEGLTHLLNSYFSEMAVIATEHGATIDKFMGDAIVMFFGDPETKGGAEDALACVRMAVAMQLRMVALREKWRALGYGDGFHVRMAINTGFCDVGNFGSQQRMHYTAIGSEVNKTARLQSKAAPDGVVLTAETYALVADHVAVTEREPARLEGVAEPVPHVAVDIPWPNARAVTHVIRAETEVLKVQLDLSNLDARQRAEALSRLEEISQRLRDA